MIIINTMSKHAVVAIIRYGEKVLLGKKKSDSKKFLAGMWHVPGEDVEGEETDEEALRRGMKEETGLEINVGKYLSMHTTPTHKEIRWYECNATTDETVCGSDLEEIKWVEKTRVIETVDKIVSDLWPPEIKKYFG
jgi:8-oxo-dGTP diphosphatase